VLNCISLTTVEVSVEGTCGMWLRVVW